MARPTLYHNPACSKSRGALEILRDRGVAFDIVDYLAEPLDRTALTSVAERLPGPPEDLIRRDRQFELLGLDASQYTTIEAAVELLLEHPELMQRPVLVAGDRALICRPPDRVLELL